MNTFTISALDTLVNEKVKAQIKETIDQKTKPLGSLGQLEALAFQLACVQYAQTGQLKIQADKAQMLIFAGDHGIAQHGISIAPSEVTSQMVLNFINGGAAINCFCRVNNIDLKVIDAGIKLPVTADHANFIVKRIAAGTNDITQRAAMTIEQAERAIQYGAEIVQQQITNGADLMAFGEMGIGNTSSAAALLSTLTGEAAELCVGKGTGINNEQYKLKLTLIKQAIERCNRTQTQAQSQSQYQTKKTPIETLAQVGGFEIAQMVGGMLATAQAKKCILVDGFISSIAALTAVSLYPASRDYMVFCHKSEEFGHQLIINKLNAKPLLDLSLRLGEGTGAALAVPLIRSAAEFYNNMASFSQANVTPV
ncbi:nicotinate-nucleotide--dimethylbenzimidazole phosphoribosyltransferase [Catenovulum sediminis]|uniref:Nicotinate-nucleotide--dimethylbenzimidazole phosphoribosyltransferase n=1 Tax=Catenovulum sediminis TaxID=1740262 RepID=A0ABV1RJ02_9ALTE|nr:nicotinate-nucleotide--dimethylbenzimidazole phosphoribosyltransferase [Catenovulum sediminis]